MKAVIQLVSAAAVSVDGEPIGSIDKGYLILLGVENGDTEWDARVLAQKTAVLRIFKDGKDKMNLSLLDVGGGALVVSNFTLCADSRKGRRPSYTDAALPREAEKLYRLFCNELRASGVSRVETGRFGADMKVSLVNDGPVTILLDSKELRPAGEREKV